jgi:tetratricopeptide (TPR) repeat protein
MTVRSAAPQDILAAVEAALVRKPADPALQLRRAQCLLALGRPAEARTAAARAKSLAAANAVLLDAIGTVLSHAGDPAGALTAYDQALALAPDDPQLLFNRAAVRRFLGRLAEAEADYDRVIALRPDDHEAWKNRSDLRVQVGANNHVEALEARLGSLLTGAASDHRGEVHLRYALAKEYEDLGEHEKSFGHLQRGARRQRAGLRYDVAVDVATVDWIIEAFPAAPPAAVAGGQDDPGMAEAPIFIVGLPRSGTTLLDRILGSHSQLASAGELNCFALSLTDAVQRQRGARLPRRELVAQSAAVDFPALGRSYLGKARAVVPAGRFIDKMPLNYLYCGLIRRALPGARILHMTRHPMAAGYAMYKTLFRDGYPFSYDLTEIARYFAAYRRLMLHWESTLPDAILPIAYEDLVADPAGQTRRALAFCGLEWEEACAAFHLNPAPTTTASAAQVRRPLYDSSVAQWRRYERQLAVLRDQLLALGVPLPG